MSPTLVLPWLVVQAATLSQSSVPATGRHEALLTLDAPAAVHLSARSASGTACEVIDRVRGPFARGGAAGRSNCELDLLLDAGQYKVRLESSARGKGQVTLAVTPFTELNAAPVQLPSGAAAELRLEPMQQASFWVPMAARGVPYLRVSGRNAGDVRLWRNGEWLEPVALRRATVTHTPGLPMHEWWLDQPLEAGLYQLVVYGRDPVTVTGAVPDASLTVEHGFRPGPAQRSMSFTLPASGLLSLELPRTPTAAVVALDAAPAAAVQLQLGDVSAAGPLSFGAACSVPKGAVVPECAAHARSTPDRRVLLLRGPRGTRGTLEWADLVSGELALTSLTGGYYGGPSTSLGFTTRAAGRVLLSAHDLPLDPDAAPLGCQLEQLVGDGRRVLGRAATRLEDGEGLEQAFNYDEGGAVVWFSVAAANRYRVRTDGGRKSRCEVYRLGPDGGLERLTQSSATDAPACDHVLALGAGDYQVQLSGGVSGIETLVVREDSKRPLKKAVARSSCQLPPLELGAGRYRLVLTRTGAISARGLNLTELPVDVRAPVHLTLEPRQALTLPLARGERFEVRASGGAPFTCRGPGSAQRAVGGPCEVAPAAGGEALALENPGERPVQLTLLRPVAPPTAPGPSAYTPSLRPLPRLTPEQPAWFDFDRAQTNTATFEVDAPGLYNVTTLGLLATACRLRTPVVDLVAQNVGAGRGRNCLIQTYLQKGRYLLSATTQGASRGRGALFLLRKPARAAAGLSGEGEAFVRVDANELLQQRLVVAKSGDYRLGTTAPGASLLCRLDDPDGWPVEPIPSPCVGQRALTPGTYLWTQLPLTVESMRRTTLERVREPVVLKGNRPHAVQAFTWYDAELGADGKDEFTFSLEGETTLDVVLTGGMQGRVFLLEKNQPPKAVEVIAPQTASPELDEAPSDEAEVEHEPEYGGEGEGEGDEEAAQPVASASAGPPLRPAPPTPSGARLTLPAGSYKLVTEHSRGDVGISYRLHLGSAVLLPGMTRTLPVPTTVPLTVPRDGTLRLRTSGDADVRCRLFDERRALVLEGSDNGADWNCAIAEPVSKGRYTLVLESETQLPGQTSVSVSLPPVEDKGRFSSGQAVSLGAAVVELSVPPTDGVQELVVASTGRAPFSCAVVGPEGVAARRSRVTDCSMLVRPKQERWTLRLWTTDGSATVSTSLRPHALVTSGSLAGAEQALEVVVTKAGRYTSAPQALCLRGRATGVLKPCGPDVSLEVGPVVFASFGPKPLPVPLTELRRPASDTPVRVELGAEPQLEAVTAPTPSLFLLSAVSPWGEAAPPVCALDGPGAAAERSASACYAAARVGTQALTRVWAPGKATVRADVTRRAVALPSRPEALTPGRRRVRFEGGVGLFSLPTSSRARVEATLPAGTWGVLLDDDGNALDVCAPAAQLRQCVVASQRGALALIGAEGQAELTTVLLEAPPAPRLFTGHYEEAPRRPGTVRLTIPPAPDARSVLVEGALRCTVVLATGEREVACRARVPAMAGAELIIEHDRAPLRALVHTPGREKWARLGVELPLVAGPSLPPAVAVPLQQGRLDRTLVVTQHSVVRVAGETGVCGLFRGNDLLSVDGSDVGCELVRVVSPGTYRLLVRPFAAQPAAGTVRWFSEPVLTLGEGVGPEAWLGPGEVRLFTFDTRARGKVGLGVQAAREALECAVYDDGYQLLGEGCHQYLSLDKGRFLLTVRNPGAAGASPLAVKPVVLGLSGDADAVPPEYLQDLFRRIEVTP